MRIEQLRFDSASAACAIALCSSLAVADDGVTLLSDGRSITALSNISQCPDVNFLAISEHPLAFESFFESIDASQECDAASALATASQNSQVSSSSMSADGTALGIASSDVFGVIHAIPRSEFDISFDVTKPQDFAVVGTLMTAGDHGPPVIAAQSAVRLWKPGAETIYEHTHTSQTPGFFDIDETFTLEPGTYRFRVTALVHIDGQVPPSASSAATFFLDIDITPTPPVGDLNGDGVVDVSDLLILLGAWGPCPKGSDCPADLNGDGVVDVSDLLTLLANWG